MDMTNGSAIDMTSITGLAIIVVGQLGIFAMAACLLHCTGLLKDTLIPQLSPSKRTYSLAKTQMAFWTLIILECFIYLVLFKNVDLSTNVISKQTLALMGISLLTAGGASAVEARQDTAEDRVNDALRAVGIVSYQDVVALQRKEGSLDAANKLAFYQNTVAGFTTQGFWKDLLSNINGAGLHRLQAVAWTLVIGVLFVWKTYNCTTLPQLDPNLVAVMGISGTGYVGFKINETNY